MREFSRIKRLPPYVFNTVIALKEEARRRGEDIVDFGMGNPDQPTPDFIVEKLVEKARDPKNHRYSASRGIRKLRLAIADWYKRNYDVNLDYESETIATIGSKEGISHLILAVIGPGESVLVPTPTYPIHTYAVIIGNGEVVHFPLSKEGDFFEKLVQAHNRVLPRPKLLILNFPHNPTTACVDLDFFEKVVAFAKEHDVMVIHDFAYADIVFDGYKAPSFLQVPGAKDVGVEIFTMSKSYNMPGWRVGFVAGNKDMIFALQRLKSYLDYGMFQPIQIASIIGLNSDRSHINGIIENYKSRRDALTDGLNRIGWNIEKPKASMFVWAEIPDQYKEMGSLKFSELLVKEAKVAVSPGIGFGEGGDDFVRFALVENEHRIKQAVRGIKKIL